MVLVKAFLVFLVVWLIAGAGLLYWARGDRKRRCRVLWGLAIAFALAVATVIGMLALVIRALSRWH